MSKNRPEVSKDGMQRIICVANGNWRLQRSTGYARDRGMDDGSNLQCLAWAIQGPPATYEECKRNASCELREARGW